MTPAERVQRILDNTIGSDLSSWEKHEFFPSVRRLSALTEIRVLEDEENDA